MEPMDDYNGEWDEAELKAVDTTFTGNVTGSATAANQLFVSLPAQGFGATQRVGGAFNGSTVEWKWNGSIAVAETRASPISLRFILDTQPNKLTAGPTDMYTSDTISAMDNLDNEGRFIELERCDIECVGTAGPQAWLEEGVFDIEERVKMFSTGGAIANCPEWALWMLFYQNGELSTTTRDTINVRVNFTNA